MNVDDRLGTFEEVVGAAPQHADTLRAIRALVAQSNPDAHETASSKERSVWWGVGPAKMKDGYAWAMPHKAHVNFGIFNGASLSDPDHRLEGTGKALRHVKLRTTDDVADPALVALLSAAIERAKGET